MRQRIRVRFRGVFEGAARHAVCDAIEWINSCALWCCAICRRCSLSQCLSFSSAARRMYPRQIAGNRQSKNLKSRTKNKPKRHALRRQFQHRLLGRPKIFSRPHFDQAGIWPESLFRDATHCADRIVIPYKPKTIVIYDGDDNIQKQVFPPRKFSRIAKHSSKRSAPRCRTRKSLCCRASPASPVGSCTANSRNRTNSSKTTQRRMRNCSLCRRRHCYARRGWQAPRQSV